MWLNFSYATDCFPAWKLSTTAIRARYSTLDPGELKLMT